MFSFSYILLDVLFGLVISRLLYLAFWNTVNSVVEICQTRLQARLSNSNNPTATIQREGGPYSSGLLSLSQKITWPSGGQGQGQIILPPTLLLWNGGGIGGTNLPDSQLSGSSGSHTQRNTSTLLSPFLLGRRSLPQHHQQQQQQRHHHHLHRDFTFEVPGARPISISRLGARHSATSATLPCRRDWIAVTDPIRGVEVPVHPEVGSVIRAIAIEILELRTVSKALNMFNTVLDSIRPASGTKEVSNQSGNDSEGATVTRLRQLPQELVSNILFLAAAPSLSPHEPRSSATNFLVLSKHYYALIVPKLYHSVSLNTPTSFRSFRFTLALHNPSLGKFVKRLQIGSSEFDTAGYCPSPLAEHGPLALGIEQMLLACPNLSELSLDLFSMSALHTGGTIHRLEKGPQPRHLCTELTTIPYLSLPTFEDLQHLELLVFGMDRETANELRTTLPLLKTLELRLVARRRGPAFHDARDTWSPTILGTLDDDDDDDDDSQTGENTRNYDIEDDDGTQRQRQEQEVDEAENEQLFHLEADMAEFMDALELLDTWPQGDSRMGERLDQIKVFAWPGAVKKLRKRFGHGRYPRIQIGLDRGYLLGPRRGAHVLWRKDRALAAWAT